MHSWDKFRFPMILKMRRNVFYSTSFPIVVWFFINQGLIWSHVRGIILIHFFLRLLTFELNLLINYLFAGSLFS